MSVIIHLWTGPRSLSTATMYSFGQRFDTKVYDEPLYAAWLARNPTAYRPYRNELLSAHENDGNIMLQKIHSDQTKSIIFCKQLGKHITGLDNTLLFQENVRHIFIVRDPIDMIDGWDRREDVHHEESSLEVLCLPQLLELFSAVRQRSPHKPVVIDASMLQAHPQEVLQIACEQLNISFTVDMLKWEAGPKPHMDGLWAPYWYSSLHKSTGFQEEVRAGGRQGAITGSQLELLKDAMPFFEVLRRHAIGVNPLNPGSSPCLPVWSGDPLQLLADRRNANVLAWIGDRLLPRELAKVSAFDSAVQGGDAVWEGLRVYNGRVFKLNEHLQRLQDSAKALAFANPPSLSFIRRAIQTTLHANGMNDQAHMRLTLTRGPKVSSSMNPSFNKFGCCLIILPEWKPVGDMTTYDNSKGIRLVTATTRRNPPQCLDSHIHHNNLLNNILAKIQANQAGAEDAIMLDLQGFVAETNATNMFLVKNGVVVTPTPDACLPGLTRQIVMMLCKENLGLALEERRVSLAEFHSADEVFTSGTMGELTPVREIDGRTIGEGGQWPVFGRIQAEYRRLTEIEGEVIDELHL